ncbi:hypothetical protein D4R87_02665 [bacterium]|nr:MAG: hypothetical protein D4R87_02665 [bacterium]
MKKLNKILTIGIIIAVITSGYQLIKLTQNNSENNQNVQKYEFQTLSDIDFSSVDQNIPKEILNKQQERYAKAIDKLENSPLDFEANMEKASVLYSFNEFEKAILIYEKMGEIKPKNFLSPKGMGDCYSKLKRYPEAEEAYLKTLENNTHELNTYLALAEIYRYHLKDDQSKILKFYENGIKNLGDNKFNLVQTYAEQLEEWGYFNKALEQWEIVLEEFPDNEPIKSKVKKLKSL